MLTTVNMMESCKTCGRRGRSKTICIETGEHICRKCCDLHNEGCYYHMFCWSKFC
jgi:hypothetical protein